jgi:hypothetical protein
VVFCGGTKSFVALEEAEHLAKGWIRAGFRSNCFVIADGQWLEPVPRFTQELGAAFENGVGIRIARDEGSCERAEKPRGEHRSSKRRNAATSLTARVLVCLQEQRRSRDEMQVIHVPLG